MSTSEKLEFVMMAMGLKTVKRAGWNKDIVKDGRRYFCDVPEPESDADHTWSTALLLSLLLFGKNLSGDEILGYFVMALIHDMPEDILGDRLTPFLSKNEVVEKDRKELATFKKMTEGLPAKLKIWLDDLMEEYVVCRTDRAKFFKDCDRADPILQALVYEMNPKNTLVASEFAETNIPKIKNLDLAKALKKLFEK